jgi:hypothetical protein
MVCGCMYDLVVASPRYGRVVSTVESRADLGAIFLVLLTLLELQACHLHRQNSCQECSIFLQLPTLKSECAHPSLMHIVSA